MIEPEILLGWVDAGAAEPIYHWLDNHPESRESLLLICALIRQGLADALANDDGDEIMAIWEWGEKVLQPFSNISQAWAIDTLHRLWPPHPELEQVWQQVRRQVLSDENFFITTGV